MALEVTTMSGGGRLSKAEYGSDLIVELIRELGIPFIALNPGSSYRGIHDSLVNFEGGGPEMVLCCHEEIAIAVAHGYSRVTGKPMVAGIHNVVGLQHASMGIYNAWVTRVPMIVIGGTGPMAAEMRRPNTDWNHTALVQGNLIRDYVKWDDQPFSVGAFPDSLLRGHRIAMTEPHGPVYLCYDVDLQEEPVAPGFELPDVARYAPPAPAAADPEALRQAAAMLASAQWPVIVAGSVGRHPEALPPLQELAELLAAPVIASGYALPTSHPLNLTASRPEVLGQADVVLALDVLDVAGAFSQTGGIKERGERPEYLKPDAKVINLSLYDLLQHSWSSDFQQLAATDIAISADTRLALPELVRLCRDALDRDSASRSRLADRRDAIEKVRDRAQERRQAAGGGASAGGITMGRVQSQLYEAVQGLPWALGGPLPGWEVESQAQLPVRIPGSSGGLGLAMGVAMGSTLAIRDSDRFYVHISGDGEFLFTPSSLWTLANMNLPILTIVNNNRSYGNDEGHQEYLAQVRRRPVENKMIGVGIRPPNTDFATVARGFGVEGFGPVEDPAELPGVLSRAAQIVAKERRPVLVDVVTTNTGRERP